MIIYPNLIILFVFLYSLSHESFTYLSKKKRFDEIHKILKNIAKVNKTEFEEHSWKSFLTKETAEVKCEKKITKTVKPHFILILILVFNW